MTELNMHPRRTLVIGLDGATFDLIKPWAAEGRLPALSHIMSQGLILNLGVPYHR